MTVFLFLFFWYILTFLTRALSHHHHPQHLHVLLPFSFCFCVCTLSWFRLLSGSQQRDRSEGKMQRFIVSHVAVTFQSMYSTCTSSNSRIPSSNLLLPLMLYIPYDNDKYDTCEYVHSDACTHAVCGAEGTELTQQECQHTSTSAAAVHLSSNAR